ncbi:PadR family transcriptional regulator [Plantactinospora soyae]|uniref:DNA-binding PadR family transcriptional regulator n=1 Tax=Plantactinospora soyae TaxID=1544732 RepID=A0A927M9Y1_9ACTN|nr:PadR family transcriptional regulator [Plantactinospora soyae]MBE1490878.1 DNA-binding PadR family transcriptional regulator [Plantactinospora soyae]
MATVVADLVGLTVLALLAERPCHPYEMQRLIRQRRKEQAVGSPRGLYRAVQRLERGGLIESAEVGRAGNRPERTTYRITAEGFEQFQHQLDDLLAVPDTDQPTFTTAVALLAHLSSESAIRALESRAVLLSGQIAEMAAQLAGLGPILHRVLLVELEYLLALRRTELEWVRALRSDIADGTLNWDAEAIRSGTAAPPGPVPEGGPMT